MQKRASLGPPKEIFRGLKAGSASCSILLRLQLMKKDVTEIKQGSFVECNGVLPLKGLCLFRNDILHFVGVGGFPRGRPKAMKFVFSHSKLKKQPSFAEFQNPGRAKAHRCRPFRRPCFILYFMDFVQKKVLIYSVSNNHSL